MRAWARAPRDLSCGNCGVRCERGTPVMEIRLVKVRWPLVRCATCVGLEPPPDLPPLVAPPAAHELVELAGAMALRSTRREWMPYRDPGEDD